MYGLGSVFATIGLRVHRSSGKLARMEPVTVTRSIQLPAPAAAVWSSLADGHGLSGWLADEVDLVVARGSSGTARDGAVTRRLVVTDVDEGRAVGFVWWDEARPAEASVVAISVADDEQGCTVTVTEQLLGAGAVAQLGDATVADLTMVEAGWDRRLARAGRPRPSSPSSPHPCDPSAVRRRPPPTTAPRRSSTRSATAPGGSCSRPSARPARRPRPSSLPIGR